MGVVLVYSVNSEENIETRFDRRPQRLRYHGQFWNGDG